MTLRLFVATCAVCLLGGSWSPAEACSCVASGPVCQAYWNTDAVFDATVVRIESVKRDEQFAGRTVAVRKHLVTLDVRQSWKGAAPGSLQVITHPDGAGCGFGFKLGARYLVFARHGRGPELEVSLCSATREYDGAGDAAEFLASLAKPPQGGRVFGTIAFRAARPAGAAETAAPPLDLTVTIAGQRVTASQKAQGGKFEFAGLPPDTYETSVKVPEGYSARGWVDTVVLPSAHACAESNFTIAPYGRITGQVVDSRGRGVRHVSLEIVGADATLPPEYGSWVSAYADENGVFDVRDLAPGRYVAGINLADLPTEYRPYPRILYPGADQPAHVIEVTLGQTVDLGRWQLPPPLTAMKMRGVVLWSDGTPAAGVYVSLSDVTSVQSDRMRGIGGNQTLADGRFAIDAFAGRTYLVNARLGNRALPIGDVRIQAVTGMDALKLVVQREPSR